MYFKDPKVHYNGADPKDLANILWLKNRAPENVVNLAINYPDFPEATGRIVVWREPRLKQSVQEASPQMSNTLSQSRSTATCLTHRSDIFTDGRDGSHLWQGQGQNSVCWGWPQSHQQWGFDGWSSAPTALQLETTNQTPMAIESFSTSSVMQF